MKVNYESKVHRHSPEWPYLGNGDGDSSPPEPKVDLGIGTTVTKQAELHCVVESWFLRYPSV